MNKNALSRWMLKNRLRLRNVNPIHLVAIAIWATGIGLWLWVIPSLKNQCVEATKQVKQLQANLAHMPASPQQTELTVSQQHLRNFYVSLGESHYAEQQVATIIALATKNGLSMAQTDYKLAENKNGDFYTYTVTIPIKGQYAMIRSFCDQMLLAVPFAALDELSFKRSSISNQIIETRVRFTLYLDYALGVEGLTFPPEHKKESE